MHRRIVGVFCAMTVLMTLLIYRIYQIDRTDYITMAASVQGKYNLQVAATRGGIYDRNFRPLVNNQYRYVASVLPTPQAASALLEVTPEDERDGLLKRLTDGRPFALDVEDNNIYAAGVDLFRVPERYGGYVYAPHLIGYLGDGDRGVAGLERAYDEALTQAGGKIGVTYQLDAAGRVLMENAVSIHRSGEEATGGVVLSLDSRIQKIAQDALSESGERGAAVVVEAFTGDILAMASLPDFDQRDIAASLDRDDAPFINRAISGYNIGSVFKVLVAAAALESGISSYHEYECEGYVDIDGQVFRCNNHAIHGVCDMERALEVSCNTYFIHLAQLLDKQSLLTFLENMGLAGSVELAPGIATQPGNLPTAAELDNAAAYANFSFGQGSSLATPLQMARAIATIAAAGNSPQVRLVHGFTDNGLTLSQRETGFTSNRVMSEKTAKTLQNLMIQVVEDGSGRYAAPLIGGAGGKTSSAQTGQVVDGEEIVHAWFAGFYPAEKPRYSIVVFVEDGKSGEHAAAPVFKQIADGIGRLS